MGGVWGIFRGIFIDRLLPLVEPEVKHKLGGCGLAPLKERSEDLRDVATDIEEEAEKRSDKDYEPSQQWIIWAIMFGVLILAIILTV